MTNEIKIVETKYLPPVNLRLFKFEPHFSPDWPPNPNQHQHEPIIVSVSAGTLLPPSPIGAASVTSSAGTPTVATTPSAARVSRVAREVSPSSVVATVVVTGVVAVHDGTSR